ncbi:Decarbamoylnovobiocin carbamoyltransferase [Rosistilla carotiformis]|uniref:Decarbamoylnovobiocin carbamoyltransferase n=1 Tax=Rosistilla carotiformis TaxID=2528017 RepID=A0A518JM23_9BACT|nr:Decarbamoylnovobiocin carbamoyltransferase [Rosistilla carotiformis]
MLSTNFEPQPQRSQTPYNRSHFPTPFIQSTQQLTAILGISAFYHDSAAALIVDGVIVAAAQEERFTRCKHDASFPEHAIAFCLEQAGLCRNDLDYVVFYEKPFVKFERLLETYLAVAPAGFRSFAAAMPVWLKDKLFIKRRLRRELADAPKAKLIFTGHHQSHAASAFFPSPFEEAAFLTLDGVGQWATTTWGVGRGNKLQTDHQINFPHSLGLLYSAFTYHCGFTVNSGEYKLMGLAPYGSPIYADKIREHLIDIRDDGSFWMDMRYFQYCRGLTMTNRRFSDLFQIAPRQPESEFQQRHFDMAASVQAVTEEIVLAMARHIHRQSDCKNLVLAGGVALNCVANGRLLLEGPFERIWVQPAAGDAGGALGGALFAWHQLLNKQRTVQPDQDSQAGSLLGPSYTNAAISQFLDRQAARYTQIDDDRELTRRVAELLAEGKVVGWFHGRMEFGPRALGARSILADARAPQMQSILNNKVKRRESFRPFAPIVLQDLASEWFDIAPQHDSPYMSLVTTVAKSKRTPPQDDPTSLPSDRGTQPDALSRRLNGPPRSRVPAVTHVDDSARLQTVDRVRNPRLHQLLTDFYQQTQCPVLVNTSFNVRGEPIVCTPEDAYRCFAQTEIDVLVLENCIVIKSENSDQ